MKNSIGTSWEVIARALPEGRSRRIDCPLCDTSSRNTANVSHKPDGFALYCFSCKAKPFIPHGLRSISKLNLTTSLAAQSTFLTSPMELPKDCTTNVPEHLAIWLYKSSIFKSTYQQYGICWSPELQRIILPVYKDGNLVYMQARAVIPGMKPKYLNRRDANKQGVLFESLPSTFIEGTAVVVTEAILSAIRVGWYYKAYSTMGSKLTDSAAWQLSNQNVILWYDPDIAGEEGARQAFKTLRSIGGKVYNLRTKLKPKQYTNSEIKDILLNATRVAGFHE